MFSHMIFQVLLNLWIQLLYKLIQEILILKPIKLGFTMNGNVRIKDEAKEREEEE